MVILLRSMLPQEESMEDDDLEDEDIIDEPMDQEVEVAG